MHGTQTMTEIERLRLRAKLRRLDLTDAAITAYMQ